MSRQLPDQALSIERLTLETFVRKDKRRRVLELHGAMHRRQKLLDLLDHAFIDALDERFLARVPAGEQKADLIAASLRGLGAPERCHVMGGGDLDGTDTSIEEALTRVVGYGTGALVCCLAGRLAYYESEEAKARFLLHRPQG